jgi:hypothetical protein
MVPAGAQPIRLSWRAEPAPAAPPRMPGALDVLRFQLAHAPMLVRHGADRRWTWCRDA